MSVYVVGVTGASGAPYAVRVLQGLLEAGHHVKLVVSPAGERVLAIESGVRFSGVQGGAPRTVARAPRRRGRRP